MDTDVWHGRRHGRRMFDPAFVSGVIRGTVAQAPAHTELLLAAARTA